jgi:hypothetical protein
LHRLCTTLAQNRTRPLVDAIRVVADRSDRVGPDCMCIVLPPPHLGWAEVRYDSPFAQFGEVITPDGSRLPIPAAFSPWVVTRGSLLAPSIIGGAGDWQADVGPYLVTIRAPTHASHGTLSGLSSQKRPGVPR